MFMKAVGDEIILPWWWCDGVRFLCVGCDGDVSGWVLRRGRDRMGWRERGYDGKERERKSDGWEWVL